MAITARVQSTVTSGACGFLNLSYCVDHVNPSHQVYSQALSSSPIYADQVGLIARWTYSVVNVTIQPGGGINGGGSGCDSSWLWSRATPPHNRSVSFNFQGRACRAQAFPVISGVINTSALTSGMWVIGSQYYGWNAATVGWGVLT